MPNEDSTETFRLDRGFRWIGPFFGALVPLAVWAFFIDDSEPANTTGGILAVGSLTFFAVFSHVTWVRTRVVVDRYGIKVAGILGERQAAWREIIFARVEGPNLVFHPVAGRPLKASAYLANFRSLVQLAEERGLLRSTDQAV